MISENFRFLPVLENHLSRSAWRDQDLRFSVSTRPETMNRAPRFPETNPPISQSSAGQLRFFQIQLMFDAAEDVVADDAVIAELDKHAALCLERFATDLFVGVAEEITLAARWIGEA